MIERTLLEEHAQKVQTKSKRNLHCVVCHPNHVQLIDPTDKMQVIASLDDEAHGTLLHISVTVRQKRLPTWTEMFDVWSAFTMDSFPMFILPNWTKHKNVHNNCLHLYEIPSSWREHVLNVTRHQVAIQSRPLPSWFSREQGALVRGDFGLPSYTQIKTFRSLHFSMNDDVLVAFDLSTRKYKNAFTIMNTPEPWRAGAFV